ncbi:hypothetical protein GCM10022200_00990 [Microbacterium awajiense]|uniref:SatD family protein n=1 Tax=Microbacterium awajiense TaxID=415214 RepID=A0ABP6ZZT9_9MICO
MVVAVIADIVGSRTLPDRSAAQRAIDDAVARVERDLPVSQAPLTPVVGDELQGRYGDLPEALSSLLLLRLALPDGVECRFGIGIGAVGAIPSSAGPLSDGPAWWAARAAVEALEAKQRRTVPGARTWVVAADDESEQTRDAATWANAYLLARDRLVSEMSERTRRIAYRRCLGETQQSIARTEGITQPAVSQALSSAGGSEVVEGFALLTARA